MVAANVALEILCIAISVFTLLLLIRVILSWAQVMGLRSPMSGPGRALVDLLFDLTEPVLHPLRNMIPPIRAGAVGIDISIIVAFVALAVIRATLRC